MMKRTLALLIALLLTLPVGLGLSEAQAPDDAGAAAAVDAACVSDAESTSGAESIGGEEEVTSDAVDPVVGEAEGVDLDGEEAPADTEDSDAPADTEDNAAPANTETGDVPADTEDSETLADTEDNDAPTDEGATGETAPESEDAPAGTEGADDTEPTPEADGADDTEPAPETDGADDTEPASDEGDAEPGETPAKEQGAEGEASAGDKDDGDVSEEVSGDVSEVLSEGEEDEGEDIEEYVEAAPFEESLGADLASATVLREDGSLQSVSGPKIESGDYTWADYGVWGCFIVSEDVTLEERVTVQGTNPVNLVLCDGAKLIAKKGITISTEGVLNIWAGSATSTTAVEGSGALFAGTTDGTDNTCRENASGIGGQIYQGGTRYAINIYGGRITATGGTNGSGIGGGIYDYQGATVNIYGGTVTATGGGGAAGIGGGWKGDMGYINISGGAVTATGGYNGAGIGGGAEGRGEGGGRFYTEGRITISGGTVTATGGGNAAGIGGGSEGACGRVTISGGAVTARAGSDAAAIGNGANSQGGSLHFDGGTVVAVRGDGSSTGIGNGAGSTLCTVIVTPIGAVTTDSIRAESDRLVLGDSQVHVKVGLFNTDGSIYWVPINMRYQVAQDGSCVRIEGFSGHAFDNTGVCPYCGATTNSVTYWDPIGGVHRSCEGFTVYEHQTRLSSGWYVLRGFPSTGQRIEVQGDVNFLVCDGTAMTAWDGFHVPEGSGITFWQQNASSDHAGGVYVKEVGDNKAGIGGNDGETGGSVTINGGVFEIVGGQYGAAIGGGKNGAGSAITIRGGKVTVTGGNGGAGIGGGYKGAGGTIAVSGGKVEATGTSGIGGGDGGAGGMIEISGGTVTATGGGSGAGIGGGSQGAVGAVTISGGTVTANGGDGGAGIGGGWKGDVGKVKISGGTVTAAGGLRGAGIGGGYKGAGGTITISGGTVTANGGKNGAGIGGGKNGAGGAVTITYSTVTARAGSDAQAVGRGSGSADAGSLDLPHIKVYDGPEATAPVQAAQRVDVCRGGWAKLEDCDCFALILTDPCPYCGSGAEWNWPFGVSNPGPSGETLTSSTPSDDQKPAPATTVEAPADVVTIAKVPAKVKAKARRKGRVTVSWKKIKKNKKTKALLKQIKGIEVQYSTDPNFAANVTTKSVGRKKTKATLKLKKKTVYYIRVRYTDGAGGVSNWSAVRKVKTKK